MITFDQLIITVLSSSLLASVLGNVVLEFYKTRTRKEERKRMKMEETYSTIVSSITTFYEGQFDKAKFSEFHKAYRHIWLYASDETIQSINRFLGSLKIIQKDTDTTIKLRKSDMATNYGEAVLEMRKSFYGKTNLTADDFFAISSEYLRRIWP